MRRIALLLAALLLGVAASSPVSGRPGRTEPDAVDREKAEMAAALEGASEEVQEAGQALVEAESLLPGAEQTVAEAEGRVAAAEAVSAAAAQAAEEARAALAVVEAELEAAAEAVEEALEAQASMLTATYRGVELLTVDAILTSEDPAMAVDRSTYLEFMIEGKNAAVEEVTLERRAAANAEGAASLAEAEAAEAEAAAAEALADAEERYSEAEAAREAVEELVAERADALAVAEAAEAEAEAAYEEAEAESEWLADALRVADDAGDSSSSGGSGFVQPVDGWKSSDFGWRTHPIYGTSRFHGGTDFAAGHGSTIYAADSGTVVHAGWNGGYGMLTCIGHGGDLTTCYGHQSSIRVDNGEHVDRGEEIGAVGSTGASTGAHLHFEVRVNGERVEPLDYLPSCLCR
ncbi:M23 family metallopeptidase [Glycomyces tenuis]|uniref:M23 family metallopeptidase n=1 Tax=Glycomyces tenuis TaxID=58116 RepID=UPI000689E8ED|nr:M23 family metallopeptidase [Glycomyces tenuis]